MAFLKLAKDLEIDSNLDLKNYPFDHINGQSFQKIGYNPVVEKAYHHIN
jgi:hypothetical protein